MTRFLSDKIFIWKVDNFALLWFFVMLSFVILQLNQLRKCSITPRLITLEWSFPCMCTHVHLEMRLESKSALTKFTLVLFYFLMDLHMLFEILFGCKALSTRTTWKWFLFYVAYSHVLFQLAGLAKVALTDLTLVGFCFMNLHVLFQIPIVFFTQGTPSLWRCVGYGGLGQVHDPTVGLNDDCSVFHPRSQLFLCRSICPPGSHLIMYHKRK